jgi:hypothetical protein
VDKKQREEGARITNTVFHPFLQTDRLLALVMLENYVCGVRAVG